MKNSLTIFKKFSFKKLWHNIINFFNKKDYSSNSNYSQTFYENKNIKKSNFLQNISFKLSPEEDSLITKLKNNPELLDDMNLEELQKANQAIANWRGLLAKQIEIAKTQLKINSKHS